MLAEGLAAAEREGVRGGAITPFLLDRLHRETGGATLEANVALVRRNAVLAARIAGALSRGRSATATICSAGPCDGTQRPYGARA